MDAEPRPRGQAGGVLRLERDPRPGANLVTAVSPKGVQGDPTLASREKGEPFLKLIVKEVAAMVTDFSQRDLQTPMAGVVSP